MARYIDADIANKIIDDLIEDNSLMAAPALWYGLFKIQELPAADVKPTARGEWLKISPAGIYECDQCGRNVMTNDICAYKFCHGCGAEMKGANDGIHRT